MIRSGEKWGIVSKTKPKVRLTVDEEMCKGCGLCVLACDRQAIALVEHINSRGFHPAGLVRPQECTGCAQCALMCPDACITILKSEQPATGSASTGGKRRKHG